MITRRIGRMNAHRPTPGPAQTKFAWVDSGGGGCRAPRDGGRGGKRVRNYPLSILTCHSRVGGNDKSGVGLGTYSPLSSRAKRGDPVNKKALRANARRHQ